MASEDDMLNLVESLMKPSHTLTELHEQLTSGKDTLHVLSSVA